MKVQRGVCVVLGKELQVIVPICQHVVCGSVDVLAGWLAQLFGPNSLHVLPNYLPVISLDMSQDRVKHHVTHHPPIIDHVAQLTLESHTLSTDLLPVAI